MDRGAWRAPVHRVAKSRTQLSDFTRMLTLLLLYSSTSLIIFYEYISLTMSCQLNPQIMSINLLERVLGKGEVWESETERL